MVSVGCGCAVRGLSIYPLGRDGANALGVVSGLLCFAALSFFCALLLNVSGRARVGGAQCSCSSPDGLNNQGAPHAVQPLFLTCEVTEQLNRLSVPGLEGSGTPLNLSGR
jgi:hypothetical protein